jgi:outer membrane protein TolC
MISTRIRYSTHLVLLLGPAVGARAAAQHPSRLTLDEAVRHALDHAPRLTAAHEVVAQAMGGRREALASRWPRLSLDGSVVRFEEPMIVAPFHALDLTRVPRFEETLVQGSLGLGYTLFDGGQRGGRIGEARALEQAAAFQARGVEQAVVAAAVQRYAGVLAAAEGLRAQETRLVALLAEGDRVGRFLTEGRAARVEELRVDAALARTRADSSAAAARLEVAEATLARMLGLPRDNAAAAALVPLRVTAAPPPDRADIALTVVAANPAMQAAQGRVAAAEAMVRAARAEWFPLVRLEGRTITYGASEGSYTTEWQAGIRVAYPLFTGGGRVGAIRRARAAAREAQANLLDLEETLAGDADEVVAQVTDTHRRVEALRTAVAHLGEVVRTEALALSEGAGVQSDYLRAEAEVAGARAELAVAVSAEIVARVELARLMGRLDRTMVGTIVESVP